MKPNIVPQIPSRPASRLARANRKKTFTPAMAASLAGLALTLNVTAADVTMTASDGFGEHSFDTAGHWDSGQAPTAGNNYFTANFIVRTPTSGSAITFLGDSLTISPGGALYSKINPVTITINVLTNSGRVDNAQGGTTTLLGNMFVPASGGGMDTGSGNTSATDNRTLSIGAIISGTGALTNYTSDANWANLYPGAQGTVIYTADNSAFTGPQIAINNTVIQAGSEANLGGNPPSFNPAQLTLNNGILRPTAGFALDYSNSGITIGPNGGKFDIGAGIILTNAEPLAGSGTLMLTNAGTLVQAGSAANFTGTLMVGGAATLVLSAGGSLAGSNTLFVASPATFDATAVGLTLANDQTLAGSGTVLGTVTAGPGSKISPGSSGVAANLTVGNLTLSGGANLVCDFLATNDMITVSGDLSPSGVTSIQLVNVPNVGTYPLITVAGTLGGSPANFHVSALTTRTRSYSVIYDTASTPNRVLLQVTSVGTPANLVWRGDTVNGVNNVWDIDTTSNWLNGANGDVYFDGDTVNFTDVGALNQPTLDVVVNPASVNFNASSNYTLTTLTGAGDIAGLTRLTQGGTGTVTLSVTNTYSGGTIITNGVLQPGVTLALGNPSGTTPLAAISGSGTLNINGMALDASYTNTVQIAGNGFSATQGAVDNTVGGLTSGGGDIGISSLTLLGDSTVSANANWQIGNSTTGAGIYGNGHTLTKTGNNYLYLRRAAGSALGGLVIAGGGVLFWDHADAIGTTAAITLTNGGFIDTWNPATQFGGLTFYNPIDVNDPVNGGIILNIRTPYNHPPSDIYNGSVTLNGPLTFSNTAFVAANTYNNNQNSYGKITMNGNITGSGGLLVLGNTANYVGDGNPYYGGSLVILNGNNSYSGSTLVTNFVQLLTSTANQSGGAYDLADGGTLDVAVAAGKPTMPMSSLVLEQQNLPLTGIGGNIGFTRLSSMPANPVLYVTNLTINYGFIRPPLAGYSVGQFPLIKYEGTIGGNGFAGLNLGTLPAGVTASLVDNSANHSIDLQVSTTGMVWKGNVSSNWDLYGSQNWFNPTLPGPDAYSDGQTVVFDDSAASFSVNIAQTVQPAGVTVNATNDYTFSTTQGGISGSGALIKNGPGTLTVACTNNTFTGGTYINGGTLKLADQNFVYPYGGGALNNNLGTVVVANGGTLDINGVQVPNYQSYGPDGYNVFVSGAGVGGLGALVNNNTNDNDLADPGYVTLTGDATVGGPGDINIRHGVSPQLTSQSGNYTLTKVGTGQFRIRYVTAVSTNFGPVNILQGIVSYESSSPLGFGDPAKPIYVGSGGGLAWGTAVTRCLRPLICSNNSTIYAYNITNNVFAGPVTLAGGNVNLNANFYNGMIFSNAISGAGGVTVQYQSLVTFAGTNTYTGDTVVVNCNTASGNNRGSVLRLIGNGSIANSANIILQGTNASQAFPGALDASGRVDGAFTLAAGQTLRGDSGSYIRGSVTNSGVITPGGAGNLQTMTFSNNLTLLSGGTVAMEVSLDTVVSNDVVRVVGSLNYGGTLQLANVGAAPLTNGASFKLFSSGNFTGNFATVSGSPGAGLGWSFNPTNGIATVVTTGKPTPRLTSIGLSGTTLTITATNGAAGGQYVLLGSTNVALPLAQWTPVLTNVFDNNGNLNLSTNIVNPVNGQEFYILSQ